MAFCENVRTLIWRAVRLQAMRHHFWVTILEFAFVALVLYWFNRATYRQHRKRPEPMKEPHLSPFNLYGYEKSSVVYGPKTNYTDELMTLFFSRVLEEWSEPYRGRALASRIEDAWNPDVRVNGSPAEDTRGNRSEAEHRLQVGRVAYTGDVRAECRNLDESQKPPVCVTFRGDAVLGTGASLAFDLDVSNYHKVPRTFAVGEFIPNLQDRWFPGIAVQHFIQESHLLLQRRARNNSDDLPNITVEGLPEYNFPIEAAYLDGAVLNFGLLIVFIVPLVRRVSTLSFELSSKLAEYQYIMGITQGQFFIGYFISFMFVQTVETVLCTVALYMPYGGSTRERVQLMRYVDPTLLFAAFTMFMVGLVLYAIFLACVFPKGRVGLFMAVLTAGAIIVIRNNVVSVIGHMMTKRWKKLLQAMIPYFGLFETIRIIIIARDYEGRADWFLLPRRVLQKDNVTILEIWLFMLLGDSLMVVLAWYLCKTLPWTTANPERPHFFLLPGYWCPAQIANPAPMIAPKDPLRFEEMPPNATPVIVTKQLRKVFGSRTALDVPDLIVYGGKCTILLGHNGAGKTTLMSILAGIMGPTSGTACVAGYDITLNRQIVRQHVSFCPQENIFFEDLTVLENLIYFVTLLILDEPTTGQDPESRRSIWDLLQATRKSDTSLLISSHDMEEADVLADQIIIMAHGKIIGSGSTSFLKKACNVGYKLNITKESNTFNLERTMDIVRETAPESRVEEDKQDAVTISLNTLECKNFGAMFRALEKLQPQLGFGDIGVRVASMKDAYTRINTDWVPGECRRDSMDEEAVAVVGSAGERKASWTRRLYAISVKRLTHLYRDWLLLLMGFLLPLGINAFMSFFWFRDTGSSNGEKIIAAGAHKGELPIILSSWGFGEKTVLLNEGNFSSASDQFALVVKGLGARLQIFKDAAEEIRELMPTGILDYVRTVVGGAAYETNKVRILSNPTRLLSQALVLNMVHQAQLRADSADTTAELNVTYLFSTLTEDDDHGRYLSSVDGSSIWILWLEMVSTSLSLMLSTFVVLPSVERLSRARDLQLMSGISGGDYVTYHLMVDLGVYVVAVTAWLAIMVLFGAYPLWAYAPVWSILLSFGPVLILSDYVLAEFVPSVGAGVAVVIISFTVGGPASTLTYFWLGGAASEPTWSPLRFLFMLFPPFGLTDAIVTVVATTLPGCRRRGAVGKTGFMSSLAGLDSAQRGIASSSLRSPDCELPDAKTFQWSHIKQLSHIAVFIIEAIFLYVFATNLHSGDHVATDSDIKRIVDTEPDPDSDVEEEKRYVNGICEKGSLSDHTMVVQNVHKYYDKLHAVRGINIALEPNECFGLLGVNGAGKTTTFEMLSGLVSLSAGEAYADNLKVTKCPRTWKSRVGYCFQEDGLLELLTAYEILYLLGRLRGIADADLEKLVESLIRVTDLKAYADQRCGTYSGGNKRKLSVATAILGMLPLVFLDEPFAGVDVVARHKILKAVNTLKKESKSTIVLSSHNMDECEYSCDRVTIMVAGRMKCLGSLQHLKQKFAKGFRFEFVLKRDAGHDPAQFVTAVMEQFPGIKLVDRHNNACVFIMDCKFSWSKIFNRVAKLEDNFKLEHTLIGENNLEQIFLTFAKEAGETQAAAVPLPEKEPSATVRHDSLSKEGAGASSSPTVHTSTPRSSTNRT